MHYPLREICWCQVVRVERKRNKTKHQIIIKDKLKKKTIVVFLCSFLSPRKHTTKPAARAIIEQFRLAHIHTSDVA